MEGIKKQGQLVKLVFESMDTCSYSPRQLSPQSWDLPRGGFLGRTGTLESPRGRKEKDKEKEEEEEQPLQVREYDHNNTDNKEDEMNSSSDEDSQMKTDILNNDDYQTTTNSNMSIGNYKKYHYIEQPLVVDLPLPVGHAPTNSSTTIEHIILNEHVNTITKPSITQPAITITQPSIQ
ncbi:hypothetical protein ACTFIV_004107 [Dictyostelium citrinum]